MLKFQDDYITLIKTFEDFILLTFTIIDVLKKSGRSIRKKMV